MTLPCLAVPTAVCTDHGSASYAQRGTLAISLFRGETLYILEADGGTGLNSSTCEHLL